MNTYSSLLRGARNLVIAISLVVVPGLFLATQPAGADTVSQLQQQQKAWQQEATQKQQQAQAQQTLAQQAAATVQALSSQISTVSQSIQGTQQQIQDIQSQIAQKNQDIDKLESDLRSINDQQNALIRELYIVSLSQPNEFSMFSSQPTSQREQQEQEFSDLQKAVAGVYAKTQAAEVQVESAKTALEQQNNNLTSLKSQQQSQQQTLASDQTAQQSLQQNALSTESTLQTQAQQAQAQAASLGQKIQTLLAQNWGGSPTGNRLIPVEDASWYYSQQNPAWAADTMGNSAYSVGDFGCLITSMAMLEERNGNSGMTPKYIADNGAFTSDGYYIGGPNGLSESTFDVNWTYINTQVAEGNPVIVRLNLSSYYTHFVVIYAKSGSNYLIQDPWAPTGSGYSTSLVSGYGVVSGL